MSEAHYTIRIDKDIVLLVDQDSGISTQAGRDNRGRLSHYNGGL